MSDRLGRGHSAYDMLTAAGAPELPAHHFYRIKQDPHSDHVVRVEVREISTRTGSERLSWATFSLREGLGPVLEATVRAATEAFDDAFPNGVPA
ncbi:hypothetical protein [Kribbella sp. CA-293567]|uniref:hypothetical protein n=1 Tax=Kribbella sp. CA-293567 TaxID=3002436 RepID=UPI0022DD37AB|nr:hypothetical protein [Kribbella sp. CA-293567]WBQ03816.1 hypothetical protein OX958_28080 [Kribbella sp. CA-293567]